MGVGTGAQKEGNGATTMNGKTPLGHWTTVGERDPDRLHRYPKTGVFLNYII